MNVNPTTVGLITTTMEQLKKTQMLQHSQLNRIVEIMEETLHVLRHPTVAANGNGAQTEQLQRVEEKLDQLIKWLPGLANAR